MKKKMLTILITSLVMIGVLGGFLWKMNQMSKSLNKTHKELLNEEKDTGSGDKAVKDVNPNDIIPLYLKGDQKNVMTTPIDNTSQIYDPVKSAQVEELLTDVKKKGKYTTKNPLWAYNPYGTNRDALYLYFKSDGKCYCRYTISIDNDKIPDFTRTLSNGASGNLTEEHEYQIMGLVPGQKNYIILNLYNGKDELCQTLTYTIDMPKSKEGAQVVLSTEEGRSKQTVSNGLYSVFQNKLHEIMLYDNSGVLRGELPVIDYAGENMQIIYDNLVYAVKTNQIVEVNSLGQVMERFQMNGYKQVGEYTYDGFGNIYVIATALGSKTEASKVLSIELQSGKVKQELDMDTLLPTTYAKAAKKGKKEAKNWVQLNSIQVTGTNQLLLSSPALSSMFKVSNVGSLLPKVDYIIADRKLWNHYKKLKKKVMTKALPADATPTPEVTEAVDSILDTGIKKKELFPSQYGQSGMVYQTESGLVEGQYYLYMLNNNTGNGAAASTSDSLYYRYLVDETTGTYILDDKQSLSRNKQGGSVVPLEGAVLYCQTDKNMFMEIDEHGKLICSYQIKQKLKDVSKNEWKGFWFY